MVGADEEGYVDEHEHIFDLYTKLYDFQGTNVKVISAQDLRDFYESKHKPAFTSVESGHKMSHKRKTFRDFFSSKKKIDKRKEIEYSKEIDVEPERPDKREIDVYKMAEFFIGEHSNGHFVLDECPFRRRKGTI